MITIIPAIMINQSEDLFHLFVTIPELYLTTSQQFLLTVDFHLLIIDNVLLLAMQFPQS